MPTERTKATGGMPEAIALAGQDNYLGDAKVVYAVLARFLSEAMERVAQAQTPAEQQKAKAANKDSCFRTAERFLGNDPAYTAMSWHRDPNGLFRFLRHNLGVNARTPREAVATVLADLLLQAYHAIEQTTQGKPDDAWQFALGDALNHYATALSGMGAGRAAVAAAEAGEGEGE